MGACVNEDPIRDLKNQVIALTKERDREVARCNALIAKLAELRVEKKRLDAGQAALVENYEKRDQSRLQTISDLRAEIAKLKADHASALGWQEVRTQAAIDAAKEKSRG